MKNLSAACFVVLALASAAFAKLAVVPLQEAVENSDAIVIGTLKNVFERVEENETVGQGEILVERLIAGNVGAFDGSALENDDRLPLDYVENFPCVMGSHRRIANQKGIFLLTFNDQGKIASQDFRSLDREREIKIILKKAAKSKKAFKTITLIAESERPVQSAPSVTNRESEISLAACDFGRKTSGRPLAAVLAIWGSIALYFFLYRSRYKIR